MPTYVYPTNQELIEIAQDKLPNLMADRPIFDIFPVNDVDSDILMWEQKDNFKGLQQLRGMNGAPTRVNNIGGKRFMARPGYYGEYMEITEDELTRLRPLGNLTDTFDASDLVMEKQDFLLQRRLDIIEYIGWTLLAAGTFAISGPNGVQHTDSYALQTYTPVTVWSDHANSTPLNDFRQIQLKHRGHSVSFGAGAVAWMNLVTVNHILQNTNDADLYGRRQEGLSLVNNLNQLNTLLAGDNLPQIKVYDEGYLDEAGTFQPWLADGKMVVVGQRTRGERIAEYSFTRNANNANNAPGAYQKVIDHLDRKVPRTIEVHDGHNGGPRMFYPSAVVSGAMLG